MSVKWIEKLAIGDIDAVEAMNLPFCKRCFLHLLPPTPFSPVRGMFVLGLHLLIIEP